ncbi:OsmC family protein [Virgibacillus kimchii]
MANTTFKATAKLQEGVQVKVKARNFEVIIDEPKNLGGTDTGMNPVELLLSALGSCQAIVAAVYAEKFEIEFDDFWVELEGDLDPDGFLGNPEIKKGYSEIRYNIHIDTDAPKEKVEEFVAFIEKTCPVGDTIASNTPMKLNKIITRQ